MGGYGAVVVFGSAWAFPTAVLAATAAWKRWRGAGSGDESSGDDDNDDDSRA